MYDYLTSFKEFIEEYLDVKIAATEGHETDYADENIYYVFPDVTKTVDLATGTYLIFNILPYTPEIPDVGHTSLRRIIPVEVAVQASNKDFAFWILSQFETILMVDEKAIAPFDDIDLIKLGEISFHFDEKRNVYFPIYRFNLEVYYSEVE